MPRSIADEEILASRIERDEHHLRPGCVTRCFDQGPTGCKRHVTVVVNDVVTLSLLFRNAQVGELRRGFQRPHLRAGEDRFGRQLRQVRCANDACDVVPVLVREDDGASARKALSTCCACSAKYGSSAPRPICLCMGSSIPASTMTYPSGYTTWKTVLACTLGVVGSPLTEKFFVR